MTRGIMLLTVLALLLALVWPRRGAFAWLRRALALAKRSRREDALKHLLKCEASERPATLESIAGALHITTGAAADLVNGLEADGLLQLSAGTLRLAPSGRAVALHLVRAHRLWESYLAEHTGVSAPEWHALAEKQEHLLTPGGADALAARLGHPIRDPHGDAIPPRDGSLEAERAPSLNAVAPGTAVRITHIEDEPTSVFNQITAQGLKPGMRAFVVEKDATHIRFWAHGEEHVLAPTFAENITVEPLPDHSTSDLAAHQYLSSLPQDGIARIVEISAACGGPARRRLLDLGFVPGTVVRVEMVSQGGDPVAYALRGSVIALRREQARLIRIEPVPEAA